MKNRIYITSLYVALTIPISFSLLAEQLTIEVKNFSEKGGANRKQSEVVSELIRTFITKSSHDIIGKTDILLNENIRKKKLGDESIDFSKQKFANKILVGNLSKLKTKFVIDGSLLDVTSGTIEYGHKEFTYNENDLDVAAQRFVDNILLQIDGKYSSDDHLRNNLNDSDSRNSSDLDKNKIKKTILTLYDAYINKDLEAYISVTDENARFWCSSYDLKGVEAIKAFRENVTFKKYTDFSYDLFNINIEISGKIATVNDTYKLSYTIVKTGRRIIETAPEKFMLIKKGNSWYILENQEL
jgi:ketosteroid isomerase-like protein